MSAAADPRRHPRLRAEGVVCRRGERPLFAPVDLSLHGGEIVWLRGANGSGKTTLLRALAGLSPPDAGSIRWLPPEATADEGADAVGRRPLYLAHANALKEDLAASEALRFLLGLDGAATADQDIAQALAGVSMLSRRMLPVRALSQGQRRRVALARLVAQRTPRVWLLDEPFDALDIDGISMLTGVLTRHTKRQGSVVLTSHVPLDVGTLAPIEIELRAPTAYHGEHP